LLAQPQFSTSPVSFTAVDEFTLTVNVTGTSLEGYAGDVWIWSWVSKGCSSNCDAPSNVDPANALADNALMTRDGSNPNIYRINLVAADFFQKPPSELQQIGFKLKSLSWGDGKQTDVDAFIDIDPLEFTPSVNRSFPSKPRSDDIVTLYFNQDLAGELHVKYHVGLFEAQVTAYNAEGEQVGNVFTGVASQESETLHAIQILPDYEFEEGEEVITRINYIFRAVNDNNIQAGPYELLFFEKN
jgi:hypothetical protein